MGVADNFIYRVFLTTFLAIDKYCRMFVIIFHSKSQFPRVASYLGTFAVYCHIRSRRGARCPSFIPNEFCFATKAMARATFAYLLTYLMVQKMQNKKHGKLTH